MKLSLRRILVLVTAALLVAACSSADETADKPGDTTITRQRGVPPPRQAQEDRDRKSGGFLDALSGFFEDDTGTCVNALTADRQPSGGKTLQNVAHVVERLRRLRFERFPDPRYLTAEQLARRIRRTVDQEYPDSEAARDERVLLTVGALPEGADLKALRRQSLAAETAGFYDPRTGELVVGSDAERGLNGFERLILSHELEHALADQVLRIPSYLQADRPAKGSEDLELAGLALVEGDATLTMEAYAAENLSFGDALSLLGPALAAERDSPDLPHYLAAGFLFPYEEGESFVCDLYERGGWRAVDRAYAAPPKTSAQIMFPERYFSREAALNPPDPRWPGRGWARLETRAVGAADLLWLFEAPGDDEREALSDARERAAAWAGGEAHIWVRGPRTALALALVERRGDRDLCASMRAWLEALMDVRRRTGVVRCSGRNVLAAIAPTLRTARAIAAAA